MGYHGKTGRVYNISPHAVGVIVNKRVRGDIIAKRVNLRVDHVKHSKSRLSFIERVHKNEAVRKANKEAGVFTPLKRIPAQPIKSHVVRVRVVWKLLLLFLMNLSFKVRASDDDEIVKIKINLLMRRKSNLYKIKNLIFSFNVKEFIFWIK